MEISSLHCKITNCALSIKLREAGRKCAGHMVKARRGRDFTDSCLRDLFTNQTLISSYLMKAMGNALFFNLQS